MPRAVSREAGMLMAKAPGLSHPSTFFFQSPHEDYLKQRLSEVGIYFAPPKRIPDKRGIRRGRMLVTGYLCQRIIKNGRKKQTWWVCKCSCGRFEVRRGPTLGRVKPPNGEDMCESCKVVQHAAWRAAHPIDESL